MGDSLKREFTLTGIDTGKTLPPAPGAPEGPGTPVMRPSFLSAFLANLGPALAGGLASEPGAPFGTGLGGALQGVQNYNDRQKQLTLQVQANQRQNAVAQSQIAASTAETNRLNQITPLDVQEKQLNADLLRAQVGFFSNPGNLTNAISDATRSLGTLSPAEQAQIDAAKQDAKLKRSFDPISGAVKTISQDRITAERTGQDVGKQELSAFLKNPPKGYKANPLDYARWKATLAPQINFNLQNAGTTGDVNSVAKRFGYTPEAFDQAANKYFDTGQLPPAGRGGPALAANKAIMNRAAELHPGASLAASSAEFKANSASLANVQKTFDSVSAFENTALKNLDQVAEAGKKIPDLSSRFANVPVRNISANMLGTKEMARFRTALFTAQTESARVLSSANAAGVLTNEARDEAKKVLDGDLPYPAMMASINQLKTDFRNRHDSYAQQISDIKARLGGKAASSETTSSDEFSQFSGKAR